MVIRIAAVGDVHLDEDVVGRFRPALEELPECADVLLLAGDLTRHGTEAEARCVAQEFGGLAVPVVDRARQPRPPVRPGAAGGQGAGGRRASPCWRATARCWTAPAAGSASPGVKGFGGGFAGRCASDFGEPEMKAFVRHHATRARTALGAALRALDCDMLVALTHYSPVPDTLAGEPLEIYPFLGSYQLGQAIDSAPTALAAARARARRHRARHDPRRGTASATSRTR